MDRLKNCVSKTGELVENPGKKAILKHFKLSEKKEQGEVLRAGVLNWGRIHIFC